MAKLNETRLLSDDWIVWEAIYLFATRFAPLINHQIRHRKNKKWVDEDYENVMRKGWSGHVKRYRMKLSVSVRVLLGHDMAIHHFLQILYSTQEPISCICPILFILKIHSWTLCVLHTAISLGSLCAKRRIYIRIRTNVFWQTMIYWRCNLCVFRLLQDMVIFWLARKVYTISFSSYPRWVSPGQT